MQLGSTHVPVQAALFGSKISGYSAAGDTLLTLSIKYPKLSHCKLDVHKRFQKQAQRGLLISVSYDIHVLHFESMVTLNLA